MELEKSSEPGAECTVDLVTTKGGESRPNPRRMPRSSHCCESRALLVGLGIAFVIYTLLSTLLALALVLEARSENRELRAKLEEQKVRANVLHTTHSSWTFSHSSLFGQIQINLKLCCTNILVSTDSYIMKDSG